jgi:phosphoenolpyruvate---glycerone phosphotransferase subunit DhaK
MVMKKFINDPQNLTRELLAGYEIAYGNKIRILSDKIVARATPKSPDKVRLVTLGGAGHEPALSGFVGAGMLDYSVVGDIFAAPGAPKVFEALKLADGPAGTLVVILNHAGDVLNGNLALQMAERQKLKVRKILTHEDIAPGANAPAETRRGLVGCIPLFKVAGAAAEQGLSLEQVWTIAERFNQNMATLAVAMRGASHPATGGMIADLPDDQMEIGMGQHGEGGTGTQKIMTAEQTAQIMADRLVNAVKAKAGDELLVVLNGAGATTLMELYIVMTGVKRYLDAKGIRLARAVVDELLTVQEMAGFQMMMARMDAELLRLWDAPCDTPYMTVR